MWLQTVFSGLPRSVTSSTLQQRRRAIHVAGSSASTGIPRAHEPWPSRGTAASASPARLNARSTSGQDNPVAPMMPFVVVAPLWTGSNDDHCHLVHFSFLSGSWPVLLCSVLATGIRRRHFRCEPERAAIDGLRSCVGAYPHGRGAASVKAAMASLTTHRRDLRDVRRSNASRSDVECTACSAFRS